MLQRTTARVPAGNRKYSLKGTYGTVQVAVSWHITKVGVAGVTQFGTLAPGDIVQFPVTTPLVKVPVVVVVPFELPVTFPFKVRTLPLVDEVMIILSVPVTWPAELVTSVAVPLAVSELLPVVKHGPALKKPTPVISRGSLAVPVVSVTLNATTKLSWLVGPVPPISWASQFPLVVVVTVLVGVFPQPPTASGSASTAKIANFFMYLPGIGV